MTEQATGLEQAVALDPRLEPSWKRVLGAEFANASARQLRAFLQDERDAGHRTFPPMRLVFNAFAHTPFDDVRVVIVGQDPYHGPGQAMGLSFSVPRGIPVPPSLRNMFRELEADCGIAPPAHRDLTHWADQGVLLLNTSLTVRAHEAASHAGHGWERITDAAIRALAQEREGIVFLLWGRHAQAKRTMVDARRHLVLCAPHPSPLSASKGFFGCRHFSQANAYLVDRGIEPIDWSLPE